MVNETSELAVAADRRTKERPGPLIARTAVLGQQNLNPFGDLHTLQHLSAMFARSMRGVFEPLLRRELRVWAEPLVVQRFADYRAERPEALTAWLPMMMTPSPGKALLIADGKFVLELLDLFFGGNGEAPHPIPSEFSPAAEAMIARLGGMLAPPLRAAWEPLARIDFTPGHPESNPAMLASFDADDAAIVTRFGISAGGAKPTFLDLLYPVAALKPHAPQLTGKVVSRSGDADPAWRNSLTRAAMAVRFPVRSVLDEPVISLARLMELQPGDVIPISFGADVPVMVGNDRLGLGTVGTANGRAAIKLTQLAFKDEGDFE
jgi:flagellar motor switch protein FliM